MQAFALLLAQLNPWAALIVNAVTLVETLAAAAPIKPESSAKLSAAVGAVKTGIAAIPAVSAQVTEVQSALATNDPATVTAAIGHSVEMALSICKAFGIFSKAGIVQNAAPIAGGQPNF